MSGEFQSQAEVYGRAGSRAVVAGRRAPRRAGPASDLLLPGLPASLSAFEGVARGHATYSRSVVRSLSADVSFAARREALGLPSIAPLASVMHIPMSSSFASSLDALGSWRQSLTRRLDEVAHYLGEHELLDEVGADMVDSLRQRLAGEKLVLAFVAEFSRGKSELINAIFFADTGRRVLPATPGRTTMCPVELGYDAGEPPTLALLPIETRLEGLSLGRAARASRAPGRSASSRSTRPSSSRRRCGEVMRTQRVSMDDARALGFWDDATPDDNPPLDAAAWSRCRCGATR